MQRVAKRLGELYIVIDGWYNSDFHDVHLLNVKNVQKLISVCRFTKPNVLFSYVVKKTIQSVIRTNDSVTKKTKAKISKNISVQWYGNEVIANRYASCPE